MLISFYKLGKLHGMYTSYYKNGQKEYEGRYINNKRTGDWTYWDEKGQKLETVKYQSGEIVETN